MIDNRQATSLTEEDWYRLLNHYFPQYLVTVTVGTDYLDIEFFPGEFLFYKKENGRTVSDVIEQLLVRFPPPPTIIATDNRLATSLKIEDWERLVKFYMPLAKVEIVEITDAGKFVATGLIFSFGEFLYHHPIFPFSRENISETLEVVFHFYQEWLRKR